MKKHLPWISILILSLVVHFAYFGHPRETVFDEVHFGKFVSGYFTHEYFFDIHPPLGKLIISGAAKLAGFQPGFSFGTIGDQFPDDTYLAMRFLPSLAGMLLPLVIYFLCLRLGFSRWAAWLAGILLVLDNALLVQSRFILLDSFLLLFGFLSWLFYAKFRETNSNYYLLFTACSAGLAFSVKWTGATFLLIILILEIKRLPAGKAGWKNLLILAVVPFAIYFSLFALHFALLKNPGPGDAFMKQDFQQKPLMAKFLELNAEMYRSNARLTATHPYSTLPPAGYQKLDWYTWPLMMRPIYYWNHVMARIYFLGNPLVWWAGTLGIITLLFSLRPKSPKLAFLIAGAYALNLLPFVGIPRAMFLYHYLTAMIISVIALAYIIDQHPNKQKIAIGLASVAFIFFIFFAPLSYGLPLSDNAYHLRTWLPSWE